jgi:hypothetical protein
MNRLNFAGFLSLFGLLIFLGWVPALLGDFLSSGSFLILAVGGFFWLTIAVLLGLAAWGGLSEILELTEAYGFAWAQSSDDLDELKSKALPLVDRIRKEGFLVIDQFSESEVPLELRSPLRALQARKGNDGGEAQASGPAGAITWIQNFRAQEEGRSDQAWTSISRLTDLIPLIALLGALRVWVLPAPGVSALGFTILWIGLFFLLAFVYPVLTVLKKRREKIRKRCQTLEVIIQGISQGQSSVLVDEHLRKIT